MPWLSASLGFKLLKEIDDYLLHTGVFSVLRGSLVSLGEAKSVLQDKQQMGLSCQPGSFPLLQLLNQKANLP